VVTIAVGGDGNTGPESMLLWVIVGMWGRLGGTEKEVGWCVGVSTSMSSSEDVN
jgi:hypothetical protein